MRSNAFACRFRWFRYFFNFRARHPQSIARKNVWVIFDKQMNRRKYVGQQTSAVTPPTKLWFVSSKALAMRRVPLAPAPRIARLLGPFYTYFGYQFSRVAFARPGRMLPPSAICLLTRLTFSLSVAAWGVTADSRPAARRRLWSSQASYSGIIFSRL